jgi:small-conductance mechanosensitive channel
MTMRRWFWVILWLIPVWAISRQSIQNEDTTVFQADQTGIIEELIRTRIKDSLERIDLIRQIQSLRESETRKRAELSEKLADYAQRDSLSDMSIKLKIDSLRKITRGYPVVPFPGDTLFYIYAKLASISAGERAKFVAGRILKLGKELDFIEDSLRTATTDISTDILYQSHIIMGITEIDARWMETSRDSLATKYKELISKSIIKYHEETNWNTLLKKSGIAIGIIVVLIIVIVLLTKLFNWLKKYIEQKAGIWFNGIKIRDYELLNVSKETTILLFLARVLQWLLVLVSVYISLPIVFGLFPWTRQLATLLFGYILTPAKYILTSVWNYLPNLFTIIVILIVFRYTLKGVRYLKDEIEREALKIPGFYPDLANPTFQIIRFLIFAFMLVVIFPFLPGSNSPVFQGVSVFLGVLFTFGSSGSLSNLISGLVITYMRSFKLGDRVKIGEVTGDVMERSMLVTRILTIKNEVISIPNSTVLSSHLTNYSSEAATRGLIINTTVTIGYDAPWRQVHDLLINAALNTKGIEKEPKPFVFQTSLDDFYVSYQINAYTREPNLQAGIYSELHQNIQDQFNEAGVEIMSPHYRSQRDGNSAAIPSTYLGKDYQPPAFRVTDPGKPQL